MSGGVAHEQDGKREGEQRDASAGAHEHVTGRELARQPATGSRGHGDAAIARGLVEPEREAPPVRADEVDLHHDGHGPGEALVDAEQDVGGHDPAPARGDGDQEGNRQRDRPTGDQEPAAAESLRERAGAEVRQRLGEPEGDDERQHRCLGRQGEVSRSDDRQGRALEPDHRADERVDDDQQGELREVLAQPELDPAGAQGTAPSTRPARLAARLTRADAQRGWQRGSREHGDHDGGNAEQGGGGRHRSERARLGDEAAVAVSAAAVDEVCRSPTRLPLPGGLRRRAGSRAGTGGARWRSAERARRSPPARAPSGSRLGPFARWGT